MQINNTYRYDNVVHRKLKIIAASKYMSTNSLVKEIFDDAIKRWEKQHGEIELFDS